MARFSLSPPASSAPRRQQTPPKSLPAAAKTPPEWKWNFPPQDQYYRSPSSPPLPRDDYDDYREGEDDWSDDESSEDGSSSEGSTFEGSSPLHSDDSDSDVEEGGEEPPHPLGFESRYGRTRFGLSPRSTMFYNQNHSPPPLRDIYDRDDEYAWNALVGIDDDRRDARDGQQSFPPIQSYHLSHQSVSTKQLLRGASSQIINQRRQDESIEEILSGMDRIANLVRAASHVDAHNHGRQPPPSQPRSTARLLQLAQACEIQQRNLPREISSLEQQCERSHQQSCQGFLLLLEADAARVSAADERIAQRERQIAELEEQKRLDQKAYEEKLRLIREEEERAAVERAAADAARSEEERRREEQRREQLRKAEEEAEEEAKRKDEHVDRAKSLIENLERVRCGGLKEFDKSKSVGRRRLQFKKIVNGKINTLSHDERKVLEVGRIVCDAISKAAEDDATAASSGAEPVTTVGKKYLLDLLCANLVVRVQADGFTGTRGDGFPLAAAFAFISTKCEEIGLVLEGHLYTVCPMAIPALSLKPSAGGGEDDLMEGLGMIRNKEGEFESFDKFLHRTEGLISIMADVMSSLPPDHTLLGGRRGALTWLQRFMDLLPPPPASPLPLLTAPVLVAFLTGAGHMLANRYPADFRTMFEAMKADVVNRLDDSPVGVPSATRLRKVLEEWGFEGLRKDMPQGAVAAMYEDGRGASAAGGLGPVPPPSFGASPPAPSPFGTEATPASLPFGMETPIPSAPAPSPFEAPALSPFGTTPAASSAPAPSPFGTAPAPAAPASSPFGTSPSPPPFGTAPAPSPFGTVPAASPFGTAPAASAPASSPFGTAPAPVPFGAAPGPASFGTAPALTPFGTTAPAASPFGAAPAPSPFGTTPASSAPAPSPFGTASATSSFGAAPALSAPAPSPFGTAAPAPSPFGTAPGPAPFGTAPSPFGGGGEGGGIEKQPCKFFASGKCNFGDKCKFSHEMGGGGGGGGGSSNPGGQFSNTFSGGGGDGGGGTRKQPCKFFAQGNCRHGDNCRFSHEMASSGSDPAFGSFGGSASNQSPSPFGGGGYGGGGGFGGSSPFGAATGTSGTPGFGASPFGGGPASMTSSSNPFGGPRR